MSIDNRKLSNHENKIFGLVRSTRPGVVAWLRRLESAHARPGGSSLDADGARGCQIGGLLSFLFRVVCDPTWDGIAWDHDRQVISHLFVTEVKNQFLTAVL